MYVSFKEGLLPKEFHIIRVLFRIEKLSALNFISMDLVRIDTHMQCVITVLSVPVLESMTWSVICTQTHHEPDVACTSASFWHNVSAWCSGSAVTYPTRCARNKGTGAQLTRRPGGQANPWSRRIGIRDPALFATASRLFWQLKRPRFGHRIRLSAWPTLHARPLLHPSTSICSCQLDQTSFLHTKVISFRRSRFSSAKSNEATVKATRWGESSRSSARQNPALCLCSRQIPRKMQ
jgi:hypothetical protein